jgi:23S rRNA (cytidine1920-2'-O)/16S rRNA (cytidine1409-2'-O)-methyltransferase
MLRFANELRLKLKGLTFSPITGGEGNIEFLAHWRLEEPEATQQENVQASLDALADQVAMEAAHTFTGNSS